MNKLIGLLSAALFILVPTIASAAVGSALGVNPQAVSGTRVLVVGADIFIGDLIETGPSGQVQIRFQDDTELVVGPSSSLRIDDYLIRNNGSAGKLAVDMLSGAFRFATGDSAKNRYIINTPTGTIGVRGTEFDVFVYRDDAAMMKTEILLYNGVVIFCTEGNVCKTLSEFCEIGELTLEQAEIVGDSRLTDRHVRAGYRANFIYAEDQSPLRRDFWFARARECLNVAPVLPSFPEFTETETDKCDQFSPPAECWEDQPG
ncbi:MAG: hypothetical protein EOP22_09695 [Hyphomicrobiales bacterium]|nr:MAG: hypothetical protein EOP22_09695 [Hyphomicrobiales bacterium]